MGIQRQADLPVRQDERSRSKVHGLQDHMAGDIAHMTALRNGVGMTSYQFDGLNVRRNDAQRVLIVHDLKSGYETVLRFTPLEYAVLVPLLEHYERPVAADVLYQAAFASSWVPHNDRRLYRHIDRMRPKLSPLGMVIRSVAHHGYILLMVPDSSAHSKY